MKPRIMLILFGIFIVLVSPLALIQTSNFTGLAVVSSTLTNKVDFPASSTFYLVIFFIAGVLAIILGIKNRKVMY